MLFYEQPTDPWIPFDFKLLEAYQRLQDEICPRCGHPVWLCRSTSNRVQFHVREAYCSAERALKEKENAGNKKISAKDKREWGRYMYTEPYVPESVGGDLPTRREYYEDLAKQH